MKSAAEMRRFSYNLNWELGGKDVDYLAADDLPGEVRLTSVFVGYNTILESKESVILSNTDVLTSHDLRTALADDDLTSCGLCAVMDLNTQILWV